MTEYDEIFEIVLYYKRSIIEKPIKPIFKELQLSNPTLNTNDVLDIYSKSLNTYKEELSQLKIMEDKILTGYVFVKEDENFMSNVKKFEENDFFIEWENDTKETIKLVTLNLK
jgi:hypothetical protein